MTMISHLGQDAVCENCGSTRPVGPCCRERHVRICDTCYSERGTDEAIKETGRCPWTSGRPDLAGAIRYELDGRVAEDQLEELLEPLSAAVERFFEPQLAQLRLAADSARAELNRAEQVVRAAVPVVTAPGLHHSSESPLTAAVGELSSLLVATYPELLDSDS